MLQCKPLYTKRDFIVSLQVNNLQQMFILYYNNGFLGLYFGEGKCLLTCFVRGVFVTAEPRAELCTQPCLTLGALLSK